jgi:hypothetical protein
MYAKIRLGITFFCALIHLGLYFDYFNAVNPGGSLCNAK